MPWVRFDDQYPIHRKVAGLSDKTYRLHSEAIFWCARNLTDGVISVLNLRQVRPGVRGLTAHADVLVKRGLWHLAGEDCASEKCPAPAGEDGWVIHDYWFYQPTKDQVQREREANARRQARFRGGRNAVTNSVTDGVTNGVTAPVSNASPARPYIGTGLNQGDSPARARARPQDFTGNINPGEGAAARHPSARPLHQALADAGVNGKPADGDTIARLAAKVRQTLTKPEDA